MKLNKFAIFSENDFSGGVTCQKRPKNAQNKRSWAIFCNFLNINRSVNQKTIQLDVFHQDFKLATGSEILFLAVQVVIFSNKKKNQNGSEIGYMWFTKTFSYGCRYFQLKKSHWVYHQIWIFEKLTFYQGQLDPQNGRNAQQNGRMGVFLVFAFH